MKKKKKQYYLSPWNNFTPVIKICICDNRHRLNVNWVWLFWWQSWKITGQVMECPDISKNSSFSRRCFQKTSDGFWHHSTWNPINQVLSYKHEKQILGYLNRKGLICIAIGLGTLLKTGESGLENWGSKASLLFASQVTAPLAPLDITKTRY